MEITDEIQNTMPEAGFDPPRSGFAFKADCSDQKSSPSLSTSTHKASVHAINRGTPSMRKLCRGDSQVDLDRVLLINHPCSHQKRLA